MRLNEARVVRIDEVASSILSDPQETRKARRMPGLSYCQSCSAGLAPAQRKSPPARGRRAGRAKYRVNQNL